MDVITLAASRAYTKATAHQFGALKGTNCKIIKNEIVDNFTEVTFQWKNDADETKTTLVKIPNGADAPTISAIYINPDNHLIVEMSDGSEIDGGEFEAGAYLTEDLIATVSIGSIKKGDRFSQKTPLENLVRAILTSEEPPAVTLSLIPSDPLYDIVNDTISSITMVVAIAEKTYPLDRARFFVNDEEVSTQPLTTSGSYQYVYNPETPINSDTIFKVIVMDEKLSTTVTKKIKFVGRTFYGVAPADIGEPTEALIKSLSATLKDVKGFKYEGITTDYGKVIYAYPKSFGDLETIIDVKNSNNYTETFSKIVLDVDGIAYNCYTQIDPSAAENIELTFA